MTAVAFQQAVGSRWIVNIILAAALLSLFKCFNGNFVAASRLFFALGRRGMVDCSVGPVHARYQTPSTAVLCVGIATAACMLLGDAILVPITEVGSVACAIGWSAACAAYLLLTRRGSSRIEVSAWNAPWLVRLAGRNCDGPDEVVPFVPGHFTVYEWLALASGSCWAHLAPRRTWQLKRELERRALNVSTKTDFANLCFLTAAYASAFCSLVCLALVSLAAPDQHALRPRHHQRPHRRRHRLALVFRRRRHPRRKNRRHRQSHPPRRASAPSTPPAKWSRPVSSTCSANRN